MSDPKAARGVFVSARGLEAALVLPNAEGASLCVYDGDREIVRAPMARDPHGVLRGLAPGLGAGGQYGFRVQGPYDPKRGLRFDPSKLLADPYAWRFDRAFRLHPSMFAFGEDTGPYTPKAIAGAPALGEPGHKRIAPEALVIYELNLRGFSRLNPAIPEAARGTFAALAHPASIAHLAALGVTAVEIMPADTFVDERHLPPLGLANAWGYNAVVFGAPDPRLAPGGWEEVRAATDALHAAGMEAILDVVFNHNGESDQFGPTLSFRGLDNEAWFRLDPNNPELYINDAGTGNCLALDRPLVIDMAIGALKRWMVYGGFDGFRFDLGTSLGRRDARLRPGLAVLPGACRRSHTRQSAPHRRALGHRARRLSPRPVRPRVRRMERPLSRRRAPLLARRPGAAWRDRDPDGGFARRVRARSSAIQGRQFRRRPRWLHASRPRLLRPQAQRGQRREQPRRHGQQQQLEPWRRGAERRSGDRRIAFARRAQSAPAFARLARDADARHGLGARLQPGRQQQRLRPGQRDKLDRLAHRRRLIDRLHDATHCGSPRQCRAVA